MTNIKALVDGLSNSDAKQAYECLKLLQEESERSAAVYPYFDVFSEMLENSNSYFRTRSIVLIAANAKWDTEYKVDEIIDDYLRHITDVKPITARQCIQALPRLAQGKPELKECIVEALRGIRLAGYKDSMRPLLEKDVRSALQQLQPK